MTNRITSTLTVLLVNGALALHCSRASADVIELRSVARLDAALPIRLADIATLEGDEAVALGDTLLAQPGQDSAPGKPRCEISLDAVRDALTARKVNWGRVALRGNSCIVRSSGVAPQPPPPSPPRVQQKPEPAAIDVSGPPTIRTRLARVLAQLYSVSPEDLRLMFDQADEDLLSQPEAGRRIEIQPEAAAISGRMPVRVRIFEGEKISIDRSVKVEALVRRETTVLKSPLQRGEALTHDALKTEPMWIDPGVGVPPPVHRLVGQRAKSRIAAGTPIRADRLESPIVVRRGELVTVRCLSGGISLTTKARAQADGREGDTIQMKLDAGSNAFMARVDGRGVAVADLDHRAAADVPSPSDAPPHALESETKPKEATP